MKKTYFRLSVEVTGRKDALLLTKLEEFEDTIPLDENIIERVPQYLSNLGWTEIIRLKVKDIRILSDCFGCRNSKGSQKSHTCL